MKNISRNLLIINLLWPVCAAGQAAPGISFFEKNLHELRQLAQPGGGQNRFPEMNVRPFFSKKTGLEWAVPMVFFSKNRVLPPAFCAADLAFFCRLELKMDKALRTPVRFRLGSQEYVDWLERKSSARFMDFNH